MEKSIWSNTELFNFESLNKDIKTDVLIVGGGICGILCAYFLKQKGIDCVVVEKGKIANGVTKNSTAKITWQHGIIYSNLIDKFGTETAKKYLEINKLAVKEYEKLCENIDCDFERLSAYTYSLNNREKIEKEVKALNDLGMVSNFQETTELPFAVAGAVCANNQAQFNPLKFIKNIVKEIKIFENTTVLHITPKYAVCQNAKIFAQKFIVATHFPFINKHGSYFLKLYQYRSYILALKNAQKLNGMYVDEADDGLSFRNSGNLLLLGGGGSRTGKKCGCWNELIRFKKQYYRNSKTEFQWATQDCISLDKIPYIGQYSLNTPHLYVATGFNKWGMTSSMVSAIILSDMVQNISNEYSNIFSPSRSIIKPQLFVNGIETVSNLLYPTKKRCSHLGCALKWNKYEHSWDCSCHGSRFNEKGTLINNPATKDANV